MSKTVYFVRHAKSSWDHMGIKDHDRPLNQRGLRDAPMMAAKLSELKQSIPQIITSTAKRAKETAAYFQSTFNIDAAQFHEEANLYHGALEDYLEGVRTWADDKFEAVALFAHNPGMTYLANNFDSSFIENVPTCGITKIIFDVDHFSEISKYNGRLEAFYYPKLYI